MNYFYLHKLLNHVKGATNHGQCQDWYLTDGDGEVRRVKAGRLLVEVAVREHLGMADVVGDSSDAEVWGNKYIMIC